MHWKLIVLSIFLSIWIKLVYNENDVISGCESILIDDEPIFFYHRKCDGEEKKIFHETVANLSFEHFSDVSLELNNYTIELGYPVLNNVEIDHLKSLTINRCDIKMENNVIQSGFGHLNSTLTAIRINRTSLTRNIFQMFFKDFQNITELYLTECYSDSIDFFAGYKFKNLDKLHLISDNIQSLNKFSLRPFPNVKEISLKSNAIKLIPTDTFYYLKSIRSIDFSFNQIDLICFKEIKNLVKRKGFENLNLQNNNFTISKV